MVSKSQSARQSHLLSANRGGRISQSRACVRKQSRPRHGDRTTRFDEPVCGELLISLENQQFATDSSQLKPTTPSLFRISSSMRAILAAPTSDRQAWKLVSVTSYGHSADERRQQHPPPGPQHYFLN